MISILEPDEVTQGRKTRYVARSPLMVVTKAMRKRLPGKPYSSTNVCRVKGSKVL